MLSTQLAKVYNLHIFQIQNVRLHQQKGFRMRVWETGEPWLTLELEFMKSMSINVDARYIIDTNSK